jgi:putative hemolysin
LMGICIVLLLFCSALMSGSEAAFFSLSPQETDKLRKAGDNRSKKVIHLISRPNELLGTILQVNNLVNILIILLSSALISRLFDFTGHPVLEFVVCTIIVTFVLVLFGEAMPKLIGTSRPVSFSRMMSAPLSFLRPIAAPINKLMELFTKNVDAGISQDVEEDPYKYLNGAVEMTIPSNPEQKKILKRILSLPKKNVTEVMTPRVDVVTLNMDMSNEEVIKVATECGFSRLPVYKENLDDVRGFLYIKDMLPFLLPENSAQNVSKSSIKKFDWHSHIREAYFVPESKKTIDLLEEFRAKKKHLAIVVDEYGGMDGIVTMEDILEEIVGEITDESDKESVENKMTTNIKITS